MGLYEMIDVPNKLRYTCLCLSVIVFPMVFSPLAILISLIVIALSSHFIAKVTAFDYEEQAKAFLIAFLVIFFIAFFDVLAYVAAALFFLMTFILIILQEWLSSFLYEYFHDGDIGRTKASLVENMSYYSITPVTLASALISFDRLSFNDLLNKDFLSISSILRELCDNPLLFKISISNYTNGIETFFSMMASSVGKLTLFVLGYSVFKIILAVFSD